MINNFLYAATPVACVFIKADAQVSTIICLLLPCFLLVLMLLQMVSGDGAVAEVGAASSGYTVDTS